MTPETAAIVYQTDISSTTHKTQICQIFTSTVTAMPVLTQSSPVKELNINPTYKRTSESRSPCSLLPKVHARRTSLNTTANTTYGATVRPDRVRAYLGSSELLQQNRKEASKGERRCTGSAVSRSVCQRFSDAC